MQTEKESLEGRGQPASLVTRILEGVRQALCRRCHPLLTEPGFNACLRWSLRATPSSVVGAGDSPLSQGTRSPSHSGKCGRMCRNLGHQRFPRPLFRVLKKLCECQAWAAREAPLRPSWQTLAWVSGVIGLCHRSRQGKEQRELWSLLGVGRGIETEV